MPFLFSHTFVNCRLTDEFGAGKVWSLSRLSLIPSGRRVSFLLELYRVNEGYVDVHAEGKSRDLDIRIQILFSNTS